MAEQHMDAITRPAKRPAGRRRAVKTAGRARGRSEMDILAEQAAAAARMLKLLGNEHRLLILCFLAAKGEMKVGDLVGAVGLSQSALSQHLALLREDGLVAFRRESQTLYYRVSDPRAARILKLLKDIYCGDLA
jgi:ArsR family transcriptional regulator, virulence genes transcriptional regulator